MNPLELIMHPVEQDLKRYQTLFNDSLCSDNPLLDMALTHLAKRQGKRMRPILVMLAARYAGRVTDKVLHAAVGLEMLHTASLVHDDIVDESDMRRGQASVNALWGAQAAVLVGDYLFSKSMQHCLLSGSLGVMELIAKLGQDLADGELLQLDLTHRDTFSDEPYYQVIDRKTAALFFTSARVGAMLGGNGEDDKAVEEMSHYAHLLGRAFQLRDDIFDFDWQNQSGKPAGNDLREGKLTLPLLYALQQAGTPEDHAMALRVRHGEAMDAEIHRMVQLAHEGGGIDYATGQMNRLADEAIARLEPGRAPVEVTDALRAYAHFVVGREL